MRHTKATRRLATLALGTALMASLPGHMATAAQTTESVPGAAGGTAGADATGTGAGATGTGPEASGDAAAADGEAQAAMLANEDAYAVEVRTLGRIARWQDAEFTRAPYRLRSGGGYTLVLTARPAPYRIEDLLQLAPQTFVKQPDGSFVLSERIFVDDGARLEIMPETATTLRMQSSSAGFVSIISSGGHLVLAGSQAAPLTITSHDPATGKPDTTLTDGRAYIRGIGGTLAMDYVEASNLGFWSGRTGGVALTGTDRPETGTLGSSKPQMYGNRDNRHLSNYDATNAAPAEEPDTINDTVVSPAGPIGAPGTSLATPDLSFVTGAINHSTFSDNAFGLFVSAAEGVSIKDNVMEDNAYAGVMLHRYVNGAVVERTTSRNNGGDGFVVTRAAEGIQLTQNTARGNDGNGFTLNGSALADGESASGMSLRSYGNHTLSNSVAEGNGGDGVEVLGAVNTIVQNNEVRDNTMGIVVRDGASGVTVTGNQVGEHLQHGISVRDGASGVSVVANIVEDAATGVYVRDSVAEVRFNTITGPDKHAVSLVGAVGASQAVSNELSGAGYSAVDIHRVTSDKAVVQVSGNDVSGWTDIRSWTRHAKRLLSPLTLMWAGVLGLVLVTAVRGRRRPETELTRPYTSTVRVNPPAQRQSVEAT